MSTSNGNTSNPSLDAGRPATSGGGEAALKLSFETHLIALQSALAVSFVALQHCPPDLVGYGGAVEGRAFFYTPENRQRLDRLDWSDIENLIGAAATRVDEALHEVLEYGPQPQALQFAAATERVTGTLHGLVYRFESEACELGPRTVNGLRSVIGVCLDAIADLHTQLSELGSLEVAARGRLN
jgi:hypothetical protein